MDVSIFSIGQTDADFLNILTEQCVRELFDQIKNTDSTINKVKLDVSALDIYSGKCFDLFRDKKVLIKRQRNKITYDTPIFSLDIATYQSFIIALERAHSCRKLLATSRGASLNESTMVIKITMRDKDIEGNLYIAQISQPLLNSKSANGRDILQYAGEKLEKRSLEKNLKSGTSLVQSMLTMVMGNAFVDSSKKFVIAHLGNSKDQTLKVCEFVQKIY